jgi:hypothetical protein
MSVEQELPGSLIGKVPPVKRPLVWIRVGSTELARHQVVFIFYNDLQYNVKASLFCMQFKN